MSLAPKGQTALPLSLFLAGSRKQNYGAVFEIFKRNFSNSLRRGLIAPAFTIMIPRAMEFAFP